MSIKLVVFDIAGTTATDNGSVVNAICEAFRDADIMVHPSDTDKIMGFKKLDAIRMLLESKAPDLAEDERIVQDIYQVFTKKTIKAFRKDNVLAPLPFAEETFASLNEMGIAVALDTAFPKTVTEALVEVLGWQQFVKSVISSEEVPQGRPYPYMIYSLMARLGIPDIASVVKVGDTIVDMKEGKNAGCAKVIGVTTGAASWEELSNAGADIVLESLETFPELLS